MIKKPDINDIETVTGNTRSIGAKISDKMAELLGSWGFIIIQSIFLTLWVILNVVWWFKWKWDIYPFIFLNLMLSFQAAYSSPIILMAQNRQALKDRALAIKTEKEVKEIMIEMHELLKDIHKNGNGKKKNAGKD